MNDVQLYKQAVKMNQLLSGHQLYLTNWM